MKLHRQIPVIIVLLVISTHLSQNMFSQIHQDVLVLTNGDTLRGEILRWEQSGLLSKKKVEIRLDDGSKWDYFIRNVKYFTHDKALYKPLPKRPWQKQESLVFCRLLMNSGQAEIYKYDDLVTSDYGPVYDWKYYLYLDSKFVEEVTNKNYREILKKHFGDCPFTETLLKDDKNRFRDDRFTELAEEWMLECGKNQR